MKLNINRC